MNADGSAQKRVSTLGQKVGGYPAFAPGGAKIAFASVGGISVMGSDGSNPVLLTPGFSRFAYAPEFSPDGTQIVFAGRQKIGSIDSEDIYTINVDGTGLTQLTTSRPTQTDPSFSPDGTKIVFTRAIYSGHEDIVVMNADGSNAQTFVTDGDHGSFSPDGTKITYTKWQDVSNTGQVWTAGVHVIDVDGTNDKQLTVKGEGCLDSQFSPDGKSIVFFGGEDGQRHVLTLSTSTEQAVGLTDWAGIVSDFGSSWEALPAHADTPPPVTPVLPTLETPGSPAPLPTVTTPDTPIATPPVVQQRVPRRDVEPPVSRLGQTSTPPLLRLSAVRLANRTKLTFMLSADSRVHIAVTGSGGRSLPVSTVRGRMGRNSLGLPARIVAAIRTGRMNRLIVTATPRLGTPVSTTLALPVSAR